MEVVLNKKYGGFSLSNEAIDMFVELKKAKGEEWKVGCLHERYKYLEDEERLKRHDEDLVKVVKMLAERANGRFSWLEVVEVPFGCFYRIDEYDGMEDIEIMDMSDWIQAV